MSCECYLGAVAVEYARASLSAFPCTIFNNNEGYYNDGGTYVPPGSGDTDRVFGKRTRTFHGTGGTYWESRDYSTSISTGESCPDVVDDTNFDPGFNYGSPLDPQYTDVFENAVTGDDLLNYAVSNAIYDSWLPVLYDAIQYFSGALSVASAQDAGNIYDTGNTRKALGYNASGVPYLAEVVKYKVRFALAGPKLPVKVLYDVYNVTDSAAVSSDNVVNLNAGNPSEEVELPLVSGKETRMTNVRFFCDPFHV